MDFKKEAGRNMWLLKGLADLPFHPVLSVCVGDGRRGMLAREGACYSSVALGCVKNSKHFQVSP